MVAPTITLPSSMLLFSIGVALLVSMISLHYKAKSLALERAGQKKALAKEIERNIYRIFAVAVFALICGVILMQWYLTSLLRTPTG
ncbi:MAG: hypothetical protein D4R82_06415 [Dehalococcoidia bacterium]|nr:MAG: hypothetical protein D4R82_06415 [Dehalococcoidia bacterium]